MWNTIEAQKLIKHSMNLQKDTINVAYKVEHDLKKFKSATTFASYTQGNLNYYLKGDLLKNMITVGALHSKEKVYNGVQATYDLTGKTVGFMG